MRFAYRLDGSFAMPASRRILSVRIADVSCDASCIAIRLCGAPSFRPPAPSLCLYADSASRSCKLSPAIVSTAGEEAEMGAAAAAAEGGPQAAAARRRGPGLQDADHHAQRQVQAQAAQAGAREGAPLHCGRAIAPNALARLL